jgi:hypothetical protein
MISISTTAVPAGQRLQDLQLDNLLNEIIVIASETEHFLVLTFW